VCSAPRAEPGRSATPGAPFSIGAARGALRGGPALGGFALIEVLCAVAVLAMVLAAVAGVFWGTVQAVERSRALAREAASSTAVADVLFRDLRFALTIYDLSEPPFIGHAGLRDGTLQSEELLSLLSTSSFAGEEATPPGVRRVRYEVRRLPGSADLYALIRTERNVSRQYGRAGHAGAEEDRVVLARRLADIQARYWDGEKWSDDWTDPVQIPLAVKIAFRLQDARDPERKAPPLEIVVAPPTAQATPAASP